jgi:hypothetical protein
MTVYLGNIPNVFFAFPNGQWFFDFEFEVRWCW